MKKKMFFGTGTLLVITFCFLCAWTWLERESESSVAVPLSFQGERLSIQDVLRYASMVDGGIAKATWTDFSIPPPSDSDSAFVIRLYGESENGPVRRDVIFEGSVFIEAKEGEHFFAIQQKNDVELAQTD